MLMHRSEIQSTVADLRARIATIERGELDSTPGTVVFLRGALEALNGVLGDVSTGS